MNVPFGPRSPATCALAAVCALVFACPGYAGRGAGRHVVALVARESSESSAMFAIDLGANEPGTARTGRAPGGVAIRVEPDASTESCRIRVDADGDGDLADEPVATLRAGGSVDVRVRRPGAARDLPYRIALEREAGAETFWWRPLYRAEGALEVGTATASVSCVDLDGDGTFSLADAARGTSLRIDRDGADGPLPPKWYYATQPVEVGGVWLVVASIAADGSSIAFEETSRRVPKLGDPLPDYALATTDGRTIRTSELRGKPLLLDFWASWCGPCVAGIPELERLVASYGGAIRAVSVDLDEAERLPLARRIVEDRGVPWPQVMRGEGARDPIWEDLGGLGDRPLGGVPFFVLIGADGTIRYAGTGAAGLDALREALRRELGPPTARDTAEALADALWAEKGVFALGPFTPLAKQNRARLALYRAWRSKTGTVRARFVRTTVEGDPIMVGLVVADGRAFLVADNRRDRFGARTVTREPVERLELDYSDRARPGRFVRAARRAPKGAALVIRCLPRGDAF